MALKDIREQIAAILASVDGVGVVHQYERWSNTWEKFLDHFKDSDDKINGWTISRRATPTERSDMPLIKRKHIFILCGVYGLNDSEASELTFQDEIEAIQDKFESKYKLNLEETVENSGPIQVKIVEPRMFGKVLCHYGELEYEVIERCTYS